MNAYVIALDWQVDNGYPSVRRLRTMVIEFEKYLRKAGVPDNTRNVIVVALNAKVDAMA